MCLGVGNHHLGNKLDHGFAGRMLDRVTQVGGGDTEFFGIKRDVPFLVVMLDDQVCKCFTDGFVAGGSRFAEHILSLAHIEFLQTVEDGQEHAFEDFFVLIVIELVNPDHQREKLFVDG